MSRDSKSLIKIILVLGLMCFGIGVFFIKDVLSYAIGVALGTAVSAARVALLERTLNKSVDMAPADAQNYTRLNYGLRMLGIIAIAFAAAKLPFINLWGFVVGLLLVQPAVYIHGLFARKNNGGDAV